MSGGGKKQTVSFREIGEPGAYFYPRAEEFRSVRRSLQTVAIYHWGMQSQFSLPVVHALKGESDVPEGFLSR